LDLRDDRVLQLRYADAGYAIPYAKLDAVKYSPNISHSVFGKTQHLLTIEYTDPQGSSCEMLLRVDKGDIHNLLGAIEERTGHPVEYKPPSVQSPGPK
jgi:hypothetical protein